MSKIVPAVQVCARIRAAAKNPINQAFLPSPPLVQVCDLEAVKKRPTISAEKVSIGGEKMEETSDAAQPSGNPCPECSKTFSTLAGLANHRRVFHGVKGSSRRTKFYRKRKAADKKAAPELFMETPEALARAAAKIRETPWNASDRRARSQATADRYLNQQKALLRRAAQMSGDSAELDFIHAIERLLNNVDCELARVTEHMDLEEMQLQDLRKIRDHFTLWLASAARLTSKSAGI